MYGKETREKVYIVLITYRASIWHHNFTFFVQQTTLLENCELPKIDLSSPLKKYKSNQFVLKAPSFFLSVNVPGSVMGDGLYQQITAKDQLPHSSKPGESGGVETVDCRHNQ